MRKSLFAAAVLAAIATSGATAAEYGAATDPARAEADHRVASRPARASGTEQSRGPHVETDRRRAEEARLRRAHRHRAQRRHRRAQGRQARAEDWRSAPTSTRCRSPSRSTCRSRRRRPASTSARQVGVMHACGHDAHTAMTLGLAEILAKMRADLPGEVMLIFQPAEEGPPPGEEGGAPLMVREGVFKDFKPDAIFGMHVRSALDGRHRRRHAGRRGWPAPTRSASSCTAAEPRRDAVARRRSDRDRRGDRHVGADHRQPPARSQRRIPRSSRSASSTAASASTSCRTATELQGTVRAFDEDMRTAGAGEPEAHRRTRRRGERRDRRDADPARRKQSGQQQRSGADRARAREPREGARQGSRR